MALIASFEETIWRNLRTREKLKNQTDKDGRPLFSIEVTGDIRIVYSFEAKNCTVFIWRIGRHKKAYRF